MIYKITNTTLKGTIDAPPSKSYTHRAIICAALSKGQSTLTNYLESNDTHETISTLKKFGIGIEKQSGQLKIKGNENLNNVRSEEENIVIDTIKESGSTLRFLIPVACISKAKKPILFIRKGRLKDRPIEPLMNALSKLGAIFEIKEVKEIKENKDNKDEDRKNNENKNNENKKELITIYQGIKGGKTDIPGNISSQFITGLLFACARAENDTEINLTTEIESKSYIEITMDVLNNFGIKIDVYEDMRKFIIPGNQHYNHRAHIIEGDYSSAAFLLAAGAINGNIVVRNLNTNSKQGDKEILNILKRMDTNIEVSKDNIRITKSELKGIEIDARNIPDLVPICAVLGCFATGETKIFNAERLRIKESDRLNAITMELKKMNVNIKETKDGLIIKKSDLKGAIIDPHNDHRIAMSCAIAGLNADGETIINNAECVNKSYPSFFEDIEKLKFKKI
ncbi:3-phosphoshikimate 1-carboxyvinyltransferase [groundwater metagenome]|uniref:3-phosphoshikimate 1-carboxyvinyltransferase n=1 Tax=groundwater metagenome TaxID=717931 RepID=A0A098E7R1_9ZZZZ